MKLTADVIKCDRCGRRGLLGQSTEEGPYAPREYSLRDLALNGGPVLDLCKFCRADVESFARGHDVTRDLKEQMDALAVENVEMAAKLRLADPARKTGDK
jgi:hypothetical protein